VASKVEEKYEGDGGFDFSSLYADDDMLGFYDVNFYGKIGGYKATVAVKSRMMLEHLENAMWDCKESKSAVEGKEYPLYEYGCNSAEALAKQPKVKVPAGHKKATKTKKPLIRSKDKGEIDAEREKASDGKQRGPEKSGLPTDGKNSKRRKKVGDSDGSGGEGSSRKRPKKGEVGAVAVLRKTRVQDEKRADRVLPKKQVRSSDRSK
jgi:hypothetical protein